VRIEAFQYPATPVPSSRAGWNGWADEEEADRDEKQAGGQATSSSPPLALAEVEKRAAEETRRSFEAGRERGCQEGRQAEREAQAAQQAAALDRHERQLAALVGSFAAERDRYLHTVEQEVVKLALAVAARILRREAQMDPLLLTGAVRVALSQLSASTEIQLRVPASELDLWTETVTLLPNLDVKPTVIAGEGMRLGDCIIESKLGTVDLGIRSQLGEIERGFFDRARTPAAPQLEQPHGELVERAP
jgi:flagellar assembly protein FliH